MRLRFPSYTGPTVPGLDGGGQGACESAAARQSMSAWWLRTAVRACRSRKEMP